VPGILADVNVVKQLRMLLELFQGDSRRELWESLGFTTPSFADAGLSPQDSDLVVWQKCQEQQLVLVTANRNDDGPDSLEATLRERNTPASLPVITFADAERVRRDRAYAKRVADKLLEYLFDLEAYRGVGRLYVP
jgi:hypothetical protein